MFEALQSHVYLSLVKTNQQNNSLLWDSYFQFLIKNDGFYKQAMVKAI